MRLNPTRPAAARKQTWEPQIQRPGAFPPDCTDAQIRSLQDAILLWCGRMVCSTIACDAHVLPFLVVFFSIPPAHAMGRGIHTRNSVRGLSSGEMLTSTFVKHTTINGKKENR